jgi:hypothetical protein
MSPEGLPLYEDAIGPQEIAAERDQERQALWSIENKESIDIHASAQDSSESRENVDLQVQELLEKFEKLSESRWIQWYDIFENFIQNASNDVKLNFVDRSNARNLKDAVVEFWAFPVYEFEFQQILILWSWENTSTASELDRWQNNQAQAKDNQAQEKDNQAQAKDNQAQEKIIEAIAVKKQQDIIAFKDAVSWIGISPQLKNLLVQVEAIDVTDNKNLWNLEELYNDIVWELSRNNEIEKTILPQAKESGNYEAVRSSLISLWGGENEKWWVFKKRILAWELGWKYEMSDLPVEEKIRVSAATWLRVDEVDKNTDKSGNIFSIETGEWFDVDYDVVADTRNLSLDGYTLESQVEDQWDYETPKLEYMRSEQEHLPKIKIIEDISTALEEKGLGSDELAEIKATIAHTPWVSELGIDFESMDSGDVIKTALQWALRFHQDMLQDARGVYKDTLLSLRDAHFSALEKKDKKVKEVLKFFEEIGVTNVPQYIVDQVADMLNSSPAIRAKLWMNEEIDFSGGQIGFDANPGDTWEIDFIDRQSFIEFFNTMIWWQESGLRVELSGVGIAFKNGENSIDKAQFESAMKEKTGRLDFKNQVLTNLGLL